MARLDLISRKLRSWGGTPPGQPAGRRGYVLQRLAVLAAAFLAAPILHAAPPPVSLAQLAELTPSQRASQDWFGFSIAVSGNTVAVGAFDANIETFGAVYVYVKPASGWANMTQVAKLTSSDNGRGFGTSAAISGDTIVVGAANTSNFHAPASTPGAVYVFVKPAGVWRNMTETAQLRASNATTDDSFGQSAAISGTTVVIGAPGAVVGTNQGQGAVYVFLEPRAGWKTTSRFDAELTATDGAANAGFGLSAGVSGSNVVAGAIGNNQPGAAYVFGRLSN